MKNGGARRDRTDDLKLAKLALSQLSYGPTDGGLYRHAPGQVNVTIPGSPQSYAQKSYPQGRWSLTPSRPPCIFYDSHTDFFGEAGAVALFFRGEMEDIGR